MPVLPALSMVSAPTSDRRSLHGLAVGEDPMRPQQNYRIEIDHPVTVAGSDGSFQPNLDPDRPDYVTTDGVEVWMERKHQKTRFLDADGNQIGPVHANLVPAMLWAIANGWRDPSDPDWWSDALYEEVQRGGAIHGVGRVGPWEEARP